MTTIIIYIIIKIIVITIIIIIIITSIISTTMNSMSCIQEYMYNYNVYEKIKIPIYPILRPLFFFTLEGILVILLLIKTLNRRKYL